MNDPNELVIDCQQVAKSFGKQAVLRSVDLQIPSGTIVGLLGSNGAGIRTQPGAERDSSDQVLVFRQPQRAAPTL